MRLDRAAPGVPDLLSRLLHDRQILGAVVDPLQRDLHLSDTQIGLLQGIAFSLMPGFSALLRARSVDTGADQAAVGVGTRRRA